VPGNFFCPLAFLSERSGGQHVVLPNRNQRREIAMNWDQVQGNWKQFKGNVQSKWGELTDDEVDEVQGDREALEGKIQAKYGKSKEEAKKEVNAFIDSL
jgi:uncharacterized protein YjbJ (UPF0337 family)